MKPRHFRFEKAGSDNLKVGGIDSLRGKINQLPDAIKEPLIKAIARTARGIRTEAKKNIKANFNRRSGKLLRSINVEIAKDGLGANVGTKSDVFYGLFLEFGTKTGIPRTRWLGKAYRKKRKTLKNSVRRNLRRAIRKHSKK